MNKAEDVKKKTMTEGGNHAGVSFFITLEKDENSRGIARYQAKAQICFDNHTEELSDWWQLIATGSKYFYSNPYTSCVDEVKGLIDGRLEQKNKNPSLAKKIEESMASMSPRTEPTEEQLKQMREKVEKLVSFFTAPGVAALAGIKTPVVHRWVERGRISAQAASDICKIPDIAAAGFTRELLRPDVTYWYTDAREAQAANQ